MKYFRSDGEFIPEKLPKDEIGFKSKTAVKIVKPPAAGNDTDLSFLHSKVLHNSESDEEFSFFKLCKLS